MRPLFIASALLGCVNFAMFAIADEKSSEAAKPRNYAEAAEECEKAIVRRRSELANEYSSEVDGLKRKYQAKGDLENAIAADAEWSRSLSRKPLTEEQLVEHPPELAKLQREYLELFASLAETVATEILQGLNREAAELARAGRLAEGKVLQQEIDTIKQLHLGGRNKKARSSDVAEGIDEGDVFAACEEAIRQKRAATQAQYIGELEALEKSLQAKGALEDLVKAKEERKRSMETPLLTERNVVEKPDELRELQQKYLEIEQNLASSVAGTFIARLEQRSQAFTIEGKLEEAIKAKETAERLREVHLPSRVFTVMVSLDSDWGSIYLHPAAAVEITKHEVIRGGPQVRGEVSGNKFELRGPPSRRNDSTAKITCCLKGPSRDVMLETHKGDAGSLHVKVMSRGKVLGQFSNEGNQGVDWRQSDCCRRDYEVVLP